MRTLNQGQVEFYRLAHEQAKVLAGLEAAYVEANEKLAELCGDRLVTAKDRDHLKHIAITKTQGCEARDQTIVLLQKQVNEFREKAEAASKTVEELKAQISDLKRAATPPTFQRGDVVRGRGCSSFCVVHYPDAYRGLDYEIIGHVDLPPG